MAEWQRRGLRILIEVQTSHSATPFLALAALVIVAIVLIVKLI